MINDNLSFLIAHSIHMYPAIEKSNIHLKCAHYIFVLCTIYSVNFRVYTAYALHYGNLRSKNNSIMTSEDTINRVKTIINNKIPSGRKALKGNKIISVDSKYFQNIKKISPKKE